MNFLAHLYWSDDTPLAMAGNLMPDLVRGRLPSDLPAAVQEGVRQHRRLDALTDTSPICHVARQRLRPRQGRLAGILLDVFYDHVLARHWHEHHVQPFDHFVAAAYRHLHAADHVMPEPMRQTVAMMSRENWLGGYASLEGIEHTLRRMSFRLRQRLGIGFDVEAALDDLQAQREMLRLELQQFFAHLRRLDPPLRTIVVEHERRVTV